MPDADAQKVQIEEMLKQRYFPMILQLSQNWTAEQHEKNRLSRSLAAFTMEKMADLSPAEAANCVVDGGDDCGIDAIYFDRPKNILWLNQSKAGSAPDQGANLKFCNGIRYLIAGQFDKFGSDFARVQADVEEALGTEGLKLGASIAYLIDQLGPHAISDLDTLKSELNKYISRFEWSDLGISAIYDLLLIEQASVPLDIQLTLQNWNGFNATRKAFYGIVSASQLALLYEEHGKKLFEKNIRYYLGTQAVNSAISDTVLLQPTELFFLNNGLTAICRQITPAPGATNDLGVFFLRDFSIVNGAQTVGSIAAVRNTNGTVSDAANIMITLIEVEHMEAAVGTGITRARNTQNTMRGLHFAALDPQQERLRQELALSDIIYYYRPSAEGITGGPNLITIQRAAIALACFSKSIKTIVAAKKEIGQIYDVSGPYYPTLFKEGLSGMRLCRAVRIYEYLDGILQSSETAETEMFRRMFYRHGRYFILCIVARKYPTLFSTSEIDLSDQDKIELSRGILEIAEVIYSAAEAQFNRSKGYLSIFRNLTDAEPLARHVMRVLEGASGHAASSSPSSALSSQISQSSSEVQP